MAAMASSPALPAPPAPLGTGLQVLSGARTTSMVVVGVWAAAWAVETGFALWVRRAAKTPPS